MRFLRLFCVFVMSVCWVAWAGDPAVQLQLAQQQLQRVETLVNAGALPKIRVEQAQRDLDDAHDDLILQQTLYGNVPVQSLTEQAASEMVAAAQRRVDRQQARLEDAKKLVDDGITARNSLDPVQEELNMRQMTLTLAQSRASLMTELAAAARAEHSAMAEQAGGADRIAGGMEHYEGSGSFVESKDLKPIEQAFTRKFAKPLPISADGETAVHRALGFDHRGRVDVAVNPEQREGQWLMSYLKTKKIPFYAFTRAMAGKATGAHIHIGPGSTRLQNAD